MDAPKSTCRADALPMPGPSPELGHSRCTKSPGAHEKAGREDPQIHSCRCKAPGRSLDTHIQAHAHTLQRQNTCIDHERVEFFLLFVLELIQVVLNVGI